MRTLYALLLSAGLALAQGATLVDCTPAYLTFTSATAQNLTNNNANTNVPCRSWEISYDAPTTLTALSVQIETSPNNSTWTAVPNTVCSSTVQPPCVIDGANPSTTTGNQTFSVSAYGRYMRINVTTYTGSGTLTVRVYGYKGLSARVRNTGGGGSGGGMTIAGTTNQVAVTGTCNDTSGTCTVKLPNPNVTIDAATGNVATPGTVTTGTNGGTSGSLTLSGATSGSAKITVAAAAGSPNDLQLPTSTAAGSSYVMQSDGGSPQQLSYAAPAGTGVQVVRATAIGTSGNCMQWSASGAGDAGSPCGSGAISSGATFFSTTASTTVTAASATTLIGTVTGSTTIPANTFTQGAVLEVMGQGYYTSTGSRTLTIDLKIGGTTRITTGAVTVPGATNGTWLLRCVVTTRTTGSSGTQIGNCTFFATGATLTAPAAAPMQTASTWTVNTTGTLALDLQATWDATTGSPTITASNIAAWFPGATIPGVSGVIGTALFSASGGSISNLTTTGVVTGVTRSSTGFYAVAMSSTSGYTVALAASDNNSVSVCTQLAGNTFSSVLGTTGFTMTTTGNCTTLFDPALVSVTVMKY